MAAMTGNGKPGVAAAGSHTSLLGARRVPTDLGAPKGSTGM
jgi:hypothetical protein